MVKKAFELLFKTEKGLYLVFGALTTGVSLVAFWLCFNAFMLSEDVSTFAKNVAGIIFAYFTNRAYVFKSKSEKKERLREALAFVLSRVATLVLELFCLMPLFCEALKINANVSTVISSVIVIVLNYVLSKTLVFRKDRQSK